MIRYLTTEDCRMECFLYIWAELTADEQAPVYDQEPNGMAELEKVLTFVQADDYYPTFEEKAAYLLCSISGSQYFSNGNKRLSIVVLLKFLGLNGATSKLGTDLRELLQSTFPLHHWEENAEITDPDSLFLYNLAIAIGNRQVWNTPNFSDVKKKVTETFRQLYTLPA